MLSIIDLKSSAQFTSGSNPVNLNQGFFFFCSRPFSRMIFFIFFIASNHQIVGKKNLFFTLSQLNLNLH